MPPLLIEGVGYLASALIVVSLAMTSVVRLRLISLLGSLAYTVYGILIGAWPVVIANAVIVALNVWHLRRGVAPAEDPRGARISQTVPNLVEALP